ncbi:response regulator [Acuticoccus sp. M5D2P5]|uniref:response regulator n=1 Tax=Acuticoccus kalidii TaxID=2910977 RepID=UPI001F3C4C1E|nr:response regulator [Acuticoccus kalidii]MCF3933020.1 response regulator [Acuticoccus kalidii]
MSVSDLEVQQRPLRVLLVEDNPADAELTREAFERNGMEIDLSVVADGVQALDYLHKRGPFVRVRRPDLIVLDLNVPRLHGKDVLAITKGEANLRVVPIVVLTSSAAEKDIVESYALGANCYVTKPLDLYDFRKIVSALEFFWFNIVRLPGYDDGEEK